MEKIFNPDVTNLDIHVTVDFATANSRMDFSDLIEQYRHQVDDASGLEYFATVSEATSHLEEAFEVSISLSGSADEPEATFCLIENGLAGASEEVEALWIAPILREWITGGAARVADRSWNEKNSTYQPAFAGINTMAA